LPDIIKGFDLAGTCLGIVEKDKIITGEKIKEGDVIIGLESSGVHSNGLTLARKVLDLNKWGKELLKPTRIYVKEVLSVLDENVHGCAHITGGGLLKLKRILPRGLGAELDNPMESQPVFKEIQNSAQVDDTEMYSTFNMGMGFALVVEKKAAKGIQKKLKTKSKIIGRVVKGEGISIPKRYVVL
jgi:phosphoribosylformylglycinamidine cyclo-ligase